MNRYFMKRNKYEEITYTIKLNIIMGAVLIAVFYVTKNTELISRSVWALTVLVNMVLMAVTHLICKRMLRTIFKNKKAPISHIIILRQGKENKLKRLSPREAFIKIYSETTIHTWDKEFQNNIVNMITDLVQNIPIYQYDCLPDKSAVDFLKEQVIKDNNL